METIDFRTPAMKRKSSQSAENGSSIIRAVIYERNSTPHQKLSMQNQHINLETEIAKHPEWKLLKSYRDLGKSATTTKNRDAFKEMYKDV